MCENLMNFLKCPFSLPIRLELILYNLRYLSFDNSCKVNSKLLIELFSPSKFFTNLLKKNETYFQLFFFLLFFITLSKTEIKNKI